MASWPEIGSFGTGVRFWSICCFAASMTSYFSSVELRPWTRGPVHQNIGQRGPGPLIDSRTQRGNMAAADAFGNYSQHTLEGPTSSDMPTAALTPIKEERNDESPDTVLGFAQAMRGERDVVLDPYEMTPREGRQGPAASGSTAAGEASKLGS